MGELTTLAYQELRRLASGYLRKERPGHTLQPTALVHEAYIRLASQRARWESRAHFVAMAASMMRRILVDHARKKQTRKRGSGAERISIAGLRSRNEERSTNLLALHEALEHLAVLDPRQASLVELKFFGGLSVDETAELLGISPATVKREWSHARAWLREQLKGDE